MKKNLSISFCILMLSISMNAFNQGVIINTTGAGAAININATQASPSAMLDVSSTNKGLLIPRVQLTATNNNAPIGGSIVTSLLVYNTATVNGTNGVVPGYYYWNGTNWVALIGGSSGNANNWALTGNSFTTDHVNFLGTIDDVPLNFKVHSINAGRIESAIGTANTFFGFQSGNINTGTSNIAIGYQALFSNTTGSTNTAVGVSALYANQLGRDNTAIGFNALKNNTGAGLTGFLNTAVGVNALRSNTIGCQNTAIGTHSLELNESGYYNTAAGEYSLNQNKIGIRNTASGYLSLTSNKTGNLNTAMGDEALYTNVGGDLNTAIGSYALYNTTGSIGNTAIGSWSGNNGVNNGSYNTFIGYGASANSGGYTNSTALGYGAIVTSSNRVQIGNAAIGGLVVVTAGLYVGSDARFKTNIEETVPGLSFITKLRPVTYHYNMDNIARYLNTPDSLRSKESEALKTKMLYSGFIAQEVEKTAKEIGYDFSGISKPQNEKDYYALNYAEFTVPLVKAVQELNNKNIELQKRIEALEILIKAKK